MVKRKKALKGAKGSALFMVICIMAILMVVAITAMAMVSLAHARSLQNYTASQSYVTAINTLDMIFEATDNTGAAKNYGQHDLASKTDKLAVSQPMRDAIIEFSDGTDNDGNGETGVTYGNVSISGDLLASGTDGEIKFLPFDASDPDNNIKYEVLPDPNPSMSASGSYLKASVIAGSNTISTDPNKEIYYGKVMAGDPGSDEEFAFARVKVTVKVQSGSGDTAQIRTVSRISEVRVFSKQSGGGGGSNLGGRFTQAVKTMGKYTSGTGMNVIGGLSSFGGGGSFAGLKGNTSSVYINGDFSPKDSGHDGTMDIGAGQQITINGKFTVDNNFKFNSTYDPTTDSGDKPFLYCEEIDWSNSNIPSGEMDILTKNGGKYGRDDNTISGNVLSGGDLELVGNNLNITGNVFVDGDVNILQSVKGSGTIYYTGSINKTAAEVGGLTLVKLPEGTKFDITNPVVGENGEFVVTTPTTPTKTYNVSTNQSVFGEYFEGGDVTTGNIVSAQTKPDVVDEEILSDSTGIIYIDAPKNIYDSEEDAYTVYLPAGDYTDMEIVIRGGGNVKIYQDGDVNLTSCKVWSEFVKEKVENGETIDMRTLADDPDYSVINWEVAAGAKLDIGHIGGEGTFLNAYIYGPDAGIMQTASGTPNGPEVTVIDEFGRTQKMKTWLMGAVVGNDITMSDGGPGIIFINPNGTGSGNNNNPNPNPINSQDTTVNTSNNAVVTYTNR